MSKLRAPADVLLVGAYERDNFGDLLFYLLTRKYLRYHRVVAGSIIGADMMPLLDTDVFAYNPLLAERRWDLVWVVGGEVGGVSTENALTMSLDNREGEIFDRAGPAGRLAITRYLADSVPSAPAYLPELQQFPQNASTPLVVNSVGLGAMQPPGSSTGVDRALDVLRKTSALRVRDPKSLQYLSGTNIVATMVPDMVHAMPLIYPRLQETGAAPHPKYFLFQAHTDFLMRSGIEMVAKAIVEVASTTGWHPVLFQAGLARHHDSVSQYNELLGVIHRLAPWLNPVVAPTRKPLELAAWIARSELWIGTSLHGRIIACSYAKPRVSLTNEKVDVYAGMWDAAFPSNVAVDSIASSVDDARVSVLGRASRQVSMELTSRADESTRELIKLCL